jgi:hypothetical protein
MGEKSMLGLALESFLTYYAILDNRYSWLEVRPIYRD